MQPSVSISVTNAGKKFGKEWIFRNVTLTILSSEKLVITGLNGSGKSTLLQALTGFIQLNEGAITYTNQLNSIDEDSFYKHISLSSPYLELIEDFTLTEIIKHNARFKPFMNQLTVSQVIELSGLEAHRNKYIKLFSSGMKQRLKLTLAILADAPILFLDEPTTNLDSTVISWYKQLIEDYAMNKTIIVCSNSIKDEYGFCTRFIKMEDFKS